MTSALSKDEVISASKSDLIIALVITTIMGFAFVESMSFPDVAGDFPRAITLSGLTLGLGYVMLLLVKIVKLRTAFTNGKAESIASSGMDPSPDTEAIEYVYATAGRRVWVSSLLWVAAFLVMTVTLGLFIASGIFSLIYLRWNAGKSWTFSALYAVALTLFLVALFRWLLYIPTPIGILSGL